MKNFELNIFDLLSIANKINRSLDIVLYKLCDCSDAIFARHILVAEPDENMVDIDIDHNGFINLAVAKKDYSVEADNGIKWDIDVVIGVKSSKFAILKVFCEPPFSQGWRENILDDLEHYLGFAKDYLYNE